MTTLIELVTDSLLSIGAIAINDTLEAGEVQAAVTALNMVVDSWAAEGLLVYSVTKDTFTLVNGTTSYDWGSTATAGNFVSARPVRLVYAFVRDGTTDFPVDLIGATEHDSITDKTTSGRPEKMWVNMTYPLAKAYLYPVPDAAYSLYVDSYKDMIDFSTLTATITMPPEYLLALSQNLGIKMCSYYKMQPPPLLVMQASESIRTLKRINVANTWEPVKLELPTVKPATQGTILSF